MQEKGDLSGSTDEQRHIEIEATRAGEELAESYAGYLEMVEGRVVGRQERDDMVQSHVEHAVSLYHHDRARKELEPYLVSSQGVTAEQMIGLKEAVKNAENEEDMQRFLTNNGTFLVQHLGGGHGRYVLPKPKLGAEFIPDFLVAEVSSIGLEWLGVELESPLAELFTHAGQPCAHLTQAIQQVVNWRDWLSNNLPYARAPKSENGLGLAGIDSNLPAAILMGRRKRPAPSGFNAYRRQMKLRLNIEIHTYDWLIAEAASRV